jgi:predicted DCC family thiol-disulfide oxidoreductase YuxK
MVSAKPIFIFDGECNLCISLVRFIIKHDPGEKIMFSPLQSGAGKSLLIEIGLSEKGLKSAVYLKDNRYWFRSSAILNLLKELGGGWKLFYVFIIIPEFIRDLFYNIIVRIRYRISGRKAPSQDQEAFIERRLLK